MVNFGSMLDAQKNLLKQISDQKKEEALLKEKEAVQSRLDTLESSLAKFKDKEVGEPLKNTPAVAPAPAPAKSMTLIHVGLLAGGLVLGYFITKMVSK